MTPKENFDKAKELCKGIAAENAFKDQYPFAYTIREDEKIMYG